MQPPTDPPGAAPVPPTTDSGSDEWSEVVNRVAKSIVNIKIETTAGLEGDSPYISQGTGFVVDKALGLVLTNRHIATVGL